MPSRVKKRSRVPIKILVKCSWSGARLPATNLTESSSLTSVVSSISSSLSQHTIADQESSILYMRTLVPRKDWDRVTIKDLVGESEGNILLTLNSSVGTTTSQTAVTTPIISPPLSTTTPTISSDANDAILTFDGQDNSPNTTKHGDNRDREQLNTEKLTLQDSTQTTHLSANRKVTPEESLKLLLQSNFDTNSKECIQTILKIVDNILSNPSNAKVRTLRLNNPTIQSKIVQKKGGLDVLISIGFDYNFQSNVFAKDPGHITLASEKENVNLISNTRQQLVDILTNDLGVSAKDIPQLKSSIQSNCGTDGIQRPFDPFKSHAFNTQAAAMGASDPSSNLPNDIPIESIGKTEKQLEQLINKEKQIQQKFQSEFTDRQLVAMLPHKVTDLTNSSSSPYSQEVMSARSDGSLLAAQMKKREDERRRKEEGLDGFKTKSMRDLEILQKRKVYSHAQIRISFSDGSSLSAKFLPNESIATIKDQVQSALLPEIRSKCDFDLYITPPRHILESSKSLMEEGLVPAAKVFVSWKQGKSPPVIESEPGSFLMKHLFRAPGNPSDCNSCQFPESRNVVPKSVDKVKITTTSNSRNVAQSSSTTREEEMVRRMLGKKTGFKR